MATTKKDTNTTPNNPTNEVAEFWKRTFDDQLDRIESIYAQWESVDQTGADKLYSSIDQMAELWKASVDYSFQLQNQSRTMFLDSIKQVREHVATTK